MLNSKIPTNRNKSRWCFEKNTHETEGLCDQKIADAQGGIRLLKMPCIACCGKRVWHCVPMDGL